MPRNPTPQEDALGLLAGNAREMLFDLVGSAAEARAETARLVANAAEARARQEADHLARMEQLTAEQRQALDEGDAVLLSEREAFAEERTAFRRTSAEYERQILSLSNSLRVARYETKKLRRSRDDMLESSSWRLTRFLRAVSGIRTGRRQR